ncbi:MAG: hypothetical protein KJ583_00525 [Nanoarchaeota archaeon]|nr:hypothetical protein [Nanoarchaeota archaeon]MBU1269289.1 hypothetical protein [Nanoarchaeota archaeon]MBU1603774.1 hypothetical protein [Nanoarchaeota archaeon]MBU2443899.1 hypothetical protein [Nanoarchaeota archaeon]
MVLSKKEQEKEVFLEELLNEKKEIDNSLAKTLIREDILSRIIEKNPLKKELLIKKYLNNKTIKNTLAKIHQEVMDDYSKRQTFGPGTFSGLQGQLNCIILTKRVIEEELKWSISEVIQKINYKTLYKYKLRCTKTCFTHLHELIISSYPDANLKPYYFKKASNVWIDKNGQKNEVLIKEAIREFINVLTNPKGKYKYKFKELPKWVNYKLFRMPLLPHNTNLSYLLNSCFGNSHIKAVMYTYPELNLKPYYFSNVPNKYWSGEDGLKHAKELLVELMDILTNPKGKYKLTKEEVVRIFKFKTYGKPILPYKKNLRGMLQIIFKNSPSAPFKLVLAEQNDE